MVSYFAFSHCETEYIRRNGKDAKYVENGKVGKEEKDT